jgi:protein SCO1
VPAFALYDQTGQVVQVSRFTGRRAAINFIYTRCPVPEMCPAATMRMIQLQEAAREAGIENFELISISLDPEYDTPGVLRQYAEAYKIDTSNFSFLTGPERAVGDLMEQLGILVDRSQGLSSHTLGTILVDERGIIRHRVFGSNWMVSDFLRQLEAMQNEKG